MTEAKGTNKMCSVIIPTYNEAENIKQLLDKLFETFKQISNTNFEIIVVDDNSQDETAKIVSKYPNKNVHLLEREAKLGIGSAYRHAFRRSKGDYILIMDADFSHNPIYIPEFFKSLDNSNSSVVFSSRYTGDGGVSGWDYKRTFISSAANFIGKFILRIPNSDITGSFRLYSRNVFSNIVKYSKATGFSFQLEAAFLSKYFAESFQEVPITFEDRRKGKSKLNFKEIIMFICSLIYCFFFMIYHFFFKLDNK